MSTIGLQYVHFKLNFKNIFQKYILLLQRYVNCRITFIYIIYNRGLIVVSSLKQMFERCMWLEHLSSQR